MTEPTVASTALAAGVRLVTTTGTGSMDRYGRQLAAHLDVSSELVEAAKVGAGAFGVPWPSGTAFRRLAGDIALVHRLRSRPEALLHFTHHHFARYGPLLRKPYLVTAHDMIRWFDLTGQGVMINTPNLRDRMLLRRDYAGLAAATALIAPSQVSGRDLVSYLGLDPAGVHVVPEAVDHAIFAPSERRMLSDPYVLVVGSEHPRKNLAAALEAFALLKADPRFRGLRLVKVGASGDGVEAPFRKATAAIVARLGLQREVLFTEEVPVRDLVSWYSGAVCLLMPSRYEGFGLPPLEAMACGTPVVASTAGSLPEVTGGAALLADPHDVPALAEAICRLLTDDVLRRRLVHDGLVHAARFTWRRTARETVGVYEKVLGG